MLHLHLPLKLLLLAGAACRWSCASGSYSQIFRNAFRMASLSASRGTFNMS